MASWGLETALWALRGIGRTKATKLIARKRPRLYPIFGFGGESGPGHRTGHVCTRSGRRCGPTARHCIAGCCRSAGRRACLPEGISVLRVFDVIAWMGGKARGLGEPSDRGR
ncbi:DUF6308 family protein [Rhodococcus sp. ACS1]|uniref:DUF6308 family protein n=1 Tax=Rhodococcus sp. ACS1 TaxID=2028570 RepID=UPI00211C8621|nr:DUF6308 family protein [Rhodococcus sp. ACS1]